ncbi:hypothetical protein L7F22_044626, partial [Adiantum nelumboides]|nr:hypothetical protein [Adiantum nelumboides]
QDSDSSSCKDVNSESFSQENLIADNFLSSEQNVLPFEKASLAFSNGSTRMWNVGVCGQDVQAKNRKEDGRRAGGWWRRASPEHEAAKVVLDASNGREREGVGT